MCEFRVGSYYLRYDYKVEPPPCLMEIFKKMFPCHPSDENTFILVKVELDRETGFRFVSCYWVCTHFEHCSYAEIKTLLDFMEILRRYFNAVDVSLDYLDPSFTEALVIELDYVQRFIPDISAPTM